MREKNASRTGKREDREDVLISLHPFDASGEVWVADTCKVGLARVHVKADKGRILGLGSENG